MSNDPVQEVMRNLETVFRQIEQERMRDVPVLNSALKVQAVGFVHWESDFLGVLITPWFMNLMLVPDPHVMTETGSALRDPGSKRILQLPSGKYEFIAGEEPGIGPYEVCSLFSPMFEFTDQANTVATAEAVMLALMNVENKDETSMEEATVRQIWQAQNQVEELGRNDELTNGKSRKADQLTDASNQSTKPQISRLKDQKMSRRSLLRGEFLDRRE